MGIVEVAKTTLSSKTARDTIVFSGSSVIYSASRFTAYLVAAKLLGPKTYGLWNGLLLILTYGMNSHLGVLNAMNREVPYYRGRGEFDKAHEIANIGFGTALVSSIPIPVMVVLATLIYSFAEETILGLRIVAVLLVLQQIHNFYQLALKSHNCFGLMAAQQVLFAGLTVCVLISLTYYAGFSGFLWGHALVFVLVLSFLYKYVPVRFSFQFDWAKVVHLGRIGFPIMTVGLAYGMLVSLDRIMVIAFLGKEQLGYYSLSFMAYSIMILFPMVVAQVMYPRLAKRYGKTGDPKSLGPLVYGPLRYLIPVMLLVLVAAYVLAPRFVGAFLPNYALGIPALKITFCGVFFLSFVGGFANFLNTVNKQKLYLIVQVCALSLNGFLNYLFIQLNYGITGVALGTSITYAVYGATLWFFARRAMR
jgi:O-antigen/teichoic acid export membrane protein